MQLPSMLGRQARVDRRPDERMPGRQPVAVEVDQPGSFRLFQRRAVDPQRVGGIDDESGGSARQRRERDDELHVGTQLARPLREHLDQPARQRDRIVERQPGQGVGVTDELGDGEWVATGTDGARRAAALLADLL